VEQDHDDHDLTRMQVGRTPALTLSRGQKFLLSRGGKLLPKIV
jgi:hypothetical protein